MSRRIIRRGDGRLRGRLRHSSGEAAGDDRVGMIPRLALAGTCGHPTARGLIVLTKLSSLSRRLLALAGAAEAELLPAV